MIQFRPGRSDTRTVMLRLAAVRTVRHRATCLAVASAIGFAFVFAVSIASGLALTFRSAAAQSDTTPALGPVVLGPVVLGPVAVGTRVRLWERVARDVSVPVVGRVERIARDSITLAPEAVARLVELAWPAVSRASR